MPFFACNPAGGRPPLPSAMCGLGCERWLQGEVYVCVVWEGGGFGGLVSEGGRRSLCLLALARRGDEPTDVYVCGTVCVVRGVHFACV